MVRQTNAVVVRRYMSDSRTPALTGIQVRPKGSVGSLLAVLLLFLTYGCGGQTRRPAPPSSTGMVSIDGWLLSQLARRGLECRFDLEPCERQFVEGDVRAALRVDLNRTPGPERVLVSGGDVVVVDAACRRALFREPLQFFASGEGTTDDRDLGPTATDVAWSRLSDEARRPYFATDRVGGTTEFSAGVVERGSDSLPLLALIAEGWGAGGGRFGYDTVWLDCGDLAAAEDAECRSLRVGHVEWTRAGASACDPYRRAVATVGGGRDPQPLLWLRAAPSGGLELHQFYALGYLPPNEGETCGADPPTARAQGEALRWWRGVRWEPGGVTPLEEAPFEAMGFMSPRGRGRLGPVQCGQRRSGASRCSSR